VRPKKDESAANNKMVLGFIVGTLIKPGITHRQTIAASYCGVEAGSLLAKGENGSARFLRDQATNLPY